MKISICVPTYNRATHLVNCLQSIIANKSASKTDFQICVSDNGSTDATETVVRLAQEKMLIKYRKNPSNLGALQNFLNAVEMADGEFVWLVGDDDFLLPDTINRLLHLLQQHPEVDYFYINSFHLNAQEVFSFPQPFDTSNLPTDMKPFSTWSQSGEMNFLNLVDPKISFDFLGGIYLSVFKRKKWISNVDVIDPVALSDKRDFSCLDNTFPHIKIFARAFATSKAFFHADPLSVCLTGAREWAPMYYFIRSVRLPEAVKEYRKNGLPYWQYLKCKNFALRSFLPDLLHMFLNKDRSGFVYVKTLPLILGNCLYPNFYLWAVYFLFHKLKTVFSRRFFQFVFNETQ